MNVPAQISATTTNPPQMKPSAAHIAQLAYQKWEQQGQPAGRDQEFWLQAEKQLLSETKQRQSKLAQPLSSPKIESVQKAAGADQKPIVLDNPPKPSLESSDAFQRKNKPAKPSRRF
jgi:hypothetical protein